MMRQTKEEILKAVEGSPSASYKDLINEMFPDAGENPDARSATEYKPEQTWNYEIGTHLNLFNNRLRTDAALFWLETRDQQISRFAGASGLGRETVNAGKSRSLGAELSLAAAITADFTLNTSYGYTYATFKDYVTNARVNGQLQEISYNGNYVPFVPKHTLTVGGQYIFRINPILAGAHPTECRIHRCGTCVLDGREHRQPIILRHTERTHQFPERPRTDRLLGAQCTGQGLRRLLFRKHGQRIYAERTSHPGRNRTALQILANRVCRLLQAGKSEL